MAKIYGQKGFLLGEELREDIPLHEWIHTASTLGTPMDAIYNLLAVSGSYFHERLLDYPEGIIKPSRVIHRHCHSNNILYAAYLMETHPESLKDFQFVSGLYRMKATSLSVPLEKLYFIGVHTFMTYKGAILDCTVMHYPPLLYEVKEYLGIGFEIETVVKTFDNAIDIAKKNNTTSFIASPLEFLTNESYLK